ncbi:MAG: hypothetical protein JO037_18740 [Actinobacteria bacterium]|nr:hypothetical protein [Actinomycetota bacterium]
MSSAILYLAIIAIWAVVLIPRWLHRDSAAGDRGDSAQPGSAERAEAAADDEPGSGPRRRKAQPAAETDAGSAAQTDAWPGAETDTRPGAERGARPVVAWRARAVAEADTRRAAEDDARPAAQASARADGRAAEPALRPGGPGDRRGPWPGKERKRLLAARRRLLGLLLALTAGCGALATTGMAAWWVMVAPSVMLLGYLPLLRAAARADAAWREQARTRPDRAVARATAPSRPAARDAAVRPGPVARNAAVPSDAMVSAGRPAPDAEVIDISASRYRAGEQFYDQYADAKLRAVGDLARSPAA